MWHVCLIVFGLIVSASSYGSSNTGKNIYQANCAKCHHGDRLGLSAPPLLKPFLKRKSDAKLRTIISEGLASTMMPAFPSFTDRQYSELIKYIRSDIKVTWKPSDIVASYVKGTSEPIVSKTRERPVDPTAVVERGASSIWLMNSDKIVDKFEFSNVHGGLKYNSNGKGFYVPSRDGWVGRYSFDAGYQGKVRGCIYLRNIDVSRDGKNLVLSCRIPQKLVVLDAETLKHKWSFDLDGKVSGIYSFHSVNKALYTLRDSKAAGILDYKTSSVKKIALADPLEDFFIDPFDKYIVGSSRNGTLISVYKVGEVKPIASFKTKGMPHLASAAFWYANGKFYFATPHIKINMISIYQMYDWKFVKSVDAGGNGYFVRTHYGTPYLWADTGGEKLALIDKRSYAVQHIVPMAGKKVMHTEFSSSGETAFVSIYEDEGALVLMDGATLKHKKTINAKLPVGKYNYTNKQRLNHPIHLGREVFADKCYGCHHETQQGFGPAFKKIANTRTDAMIRAQIIDPKNTSKALGYKRNAMPAFPMGAEELDALVYYIKAQIDVPSK